MRLAFPARITVLLAAAVAAPAVAQTAQTPADGVLLYESRVRPILEASCLPCHGGDPQRIRSELSLASRSGVLRGGTRGPAIDTARPARSLILRAIGYGDEQLQMPPSGRLDDEQIEVITQWLQLGAPFGGDEDDLVESTATEVFEITDEDRAWWSVQPLVRPAVPAVEDDGWPRNDVDRFILAGLEQVGLAPAT
ncbi:MAG: c-type cytochrome domain-containing protein, partial [Planctomycetota bacterium]